MPGGPEILIILVVLLLLFGGKKIPEMARGLGQAQREFRDGLREGASTDESALPPTSTSDDSSPPS